MLTPKFKIGQKVYVVTSKKNTREINVECDICNSTGYVKVEGKNGEFICPVCHRRTKTEYYGYKYEISYNEATIGKVGTEEYAPKYGKSRVTYMLEETGVGSGQVWKEERLFATEDEAKEFCEKYIPSDFYDTEAILKELEKDNDND